MILVDVGVVLVELLVVLVVVLFEGFLVGFGVEFVGSEGSVVGVSFLKN